MYINVIRFVFYPNRCPVFLLLLLSCRPNQMIILMFITFIIICDFVDSQPIVNKLDKVGIRQYKTVQNYYFWSRKLQLKCNFVSRNENLLRSFVAIFRLWLSFNVISSIMTLCSVIHAHISFSLLKHIWLRLKLLVFSILYFFFAADKTKFSDSLICLSMSGVALSFASLKLLTNLIYSIVW